MAIYLKILCHLAKHTFFDLFYKTFFDLFSKLHLNNKNKQVCFVLSSICAIFR